MEKLTSQLSAPETIQEHHLITGFDCNRSSLNDWLLRRAWRNENSGDSRTYIVANNEQRIIAYYSLAAGQVIRTDVPKSLARNAPDPISIIILGRLAIDRLYQGMGLGSALLRDAAYRAKRAAELIGARGLLVHALDEEAYSFYQSHGFVGCPVAPMTLIIALKHL